MYNKIAFRGYISHVKSFLPLQPTISLADGGFFFLPNELFDSTMEYENELKSYLVDNYQDFQLEEKDWIAIVWSKQVLENETDGLSLRSLRTYIKDSSDVYFPNAKEFKTKQLVCPLHVTYFSNSLEVLEDLEEYIAVFLEEADTYYSHFPLLDPVDDTAVKIKNFKRTEVVKEQRSIHGEICRLDTTLELSYFVSLKKAVDVPLIGKGKVKLNIRLINDLQNLSPPIN
jgi:hypothetical protein